MSENTWLWLGTCSHGGKTPHVTSRDPWGSFPSLVSIPNHSYFPFKMSAIGGTLGASGPVRATPQGCGCKASASVAPIAVMLHRLPLALVWHPVVLLAVVQALLEGQMPRPPLVDRNPAYPPTANGAADLMGPLGAEEEPQGRSPAAQHCQGCAVSSETCAFLRGQRPHLCKGKLEKAAPAPTACEHRRETITL